MGEIMLGMPGPWADDFYEASDHYTTKFGGLPDWPFPDKISKHDLLVCSSCGTNLLLVAQIYTPIATKNLTIEERQIFVFGCITETCGSSPESWVAIRAQRCSSSMVSGSGGQHISEATFVASDTDWRDDFWSLEHGEGNDNDDVDLEELGRALSDAASSANSKKENISHQYEATIESSSSNQIVRIADKTTPVLPCFYVYTHKEAFQKDVASICLSYNTSLSIKENEYKLDEPAPQESWDDEAYEYDRSLSANRTYLKFKKRVDAYPEQCFRYWYGGKPLLAAEEVEEPGRCELCGASRHYEMQLMPPLLYFLQQATGGQKYTLENWNWMTLLIYTCSDNCSNVKNEHSKVDDWIVSKEALVMQGE